MCVAVPGKIVSIDGDYADIDILGNVTRVNVKLISPKIGDYVLVHAGCALEVMKEDKATELLEIFGEVSEISGETNK